jgi:transposase
MEKLTRRRYTLEYKQEAVRLVTSGQRVAAAAKALGIVEQTLANWVKAEKAGQLRGVRSEQVSAERMENNRLRAELARVTMERDILHPTNEDLFAGTPACHPTDINPSAGTPVWEKQWRTVCYESDRCSPGGSYASLEMRVGPSEPACRSRFQTASGCIGQEPVW